MNLTIPDPLPVGISRSVQFNNGYQRRRNFAEDRHLAFSAHIGVAGKSYAKHFRIDHFGEEQAFLMASAWRREMEESAGKLSKWKGKGGVPGKRRPSQTRASSKEASPPERTSPERLRDIINGLFTKH